MSDKKPLDYEADIPFFEVHEVVVPHLGHVPIAKGDFNRLPIKVQKFIAFYVRMNINITLGLPLQCVAVNSCFI